MKRGFEHLNCDITSRTRRDVVCYKRLCSRLGEMRPSYNVLMLLFVPYTRIFFCCCCFSGNVTNIPAVLQPSSTCQWGRLLTVCCQRFTHQPIVFSLGLAMRSVSLFFFSGCHPRFSRLASRGLAAQRSRARALPLLG